ncbi:MAG: hypothetical protein EOO88_31515 [Pedobacter sp.]|nr:MAG: hypothetical protein EOO88_31515 [Pedobacter sp.]
MKKITSVSAIIFVLSIFFASLSYAQPRFENTFNSCSIYLPSGSGTSSDVSYRKVGESAWKATFPLYHDMERKEFRGSIVLLNEDTEYEVRTIIKTGDEVTEDKISRFKTWTATPTIGREVLLSSFLKSGKYVDVQNLKGSPTSWIRLIPDIAINAGTSSDYALRFVNSSYVILEGANIKGGRLNAVDLLSTASDIRLINCNISKWGRPAVSQNATGHFLDKDGVAVNYDSGVKIGKAKNIVVESLQFLVENKLVKVYGFVIMPNHIHLIWRNIQMNKKEHPDESFLKFTAHQFKKELKNTDQLDDKYLVDKADRKYQFWQRCPLLQ